MNFELQNWIVYFILGVVLYMLLGGTVKSLIKKLSSKNDLKNPESSHMKIYSDACGSCEQRHH